VLLGTTDVALFSRQSLRVFRARRGSMSPVCRGWVNDFIFQPFQNGCSPLRRAPAPAISGKALFACLDHVGQLVLLSIRNTCSSSCFDSSPAFCSFVRPQDSRLVGQCCSRKKRWPCLSRKSFGIFLDGAASRFRLFASVGKGSGLLLRPCNFLIARGGGQELTLLRFFHDSFCADS